MEVHIKEKEKEIKRGIQFARVVVHGGGGVEQSD